MTDITDPSIQTMSALQCALELAELIKLFGNEMAAIVPHEYFCYVNEYEHIKYDIGTSARHSLHYKLVLFGKSLGELTFARSTPFVEIEIQKMKALFSVLIYPLRNALLYKQAVEKAYIDTLTGINNRAAFDKAIEQEIDFAIRHHYTLTLMMLDLDKFKDVNDNYGHITGDAVLIKFTDCITQCLRRSDSLFRYGGEEFSVLLRNTRIEGAKLLAERMRKSVEEMVFAHEDAEINITVSIGLAELQATDDTKKLIARADALLYQAKKNGRNKVMS